MIWLYGCFVSCLELMNEIQRRPREKQKNTVNSQIDSNLVSQPCETVLNAPNQAGVSLRRR